VVSVPLLITSRIRVNLPLVVLFSLILQIVASPVPSPVLDQNSKKSHKIALQQHDELMDHHAQFMHNYGTRKLYSLNEAGKLLQNDSPPYHQAKTIIKVQDHKMSDHSVRDEHAYDNSNYHRSVQEFKQLRDSHNANLVASSNHIKALNKHPRPDSVRDKISEAEAMHTALTESEPWHHDHIEDTMARTELILLQNNGRHRAKTPRSTQEVEKKASRVAEIMSKTPRIHQVDA
jgi:hypothetical protein